MTIRIEDRVLQELFLLTHAKTKTEAISKALQEFIKRKGKEKLLSLKGKMNLINDWKELREEELNEK
ncbi:MAG: type II toxin-antitoxin system VapB family antitoxin [bacterium]|nr:type II toxin-antitoxin system VapB family antitoxin [bacterium]